MPADIVVTYGDGSKEQDVLSDGASRGYFDVSDGTLLEEEIGLYILSCAKDGRATTVGYAIVSDWDSESCPVFEPGEEEPSGLKIRGRIRRIVATLRPNELFRASLDNGAVQFELEITHRDPSA